MAPDNGLRTTDNWNAILAIIGQSKAKVPSMNSILLILLGVVLGAVIVWLLAAARTRTELAKSQVDAEGRVKAAEGALQEVRARVGALQASLDAGGRELANL